MSYIGVPPVSGDFVVLDNITTSATASYTLQRSSVNFAPESANHMLVSLNGSIQKPNSSFTISGSTITFSSALTSSDVIDFILVLGNVNAVGVATTVSDSAITKAKTDFVSSGSGYTGTGLDIKGNGSANGRLGLLCSAGTHGVAIESPDHSSAQSYTIQLPSNSPTVDKFIKVTSLTGSGATAIAHTQFADAGSDGFVLVDNGNGTNATSLSIQSKFTSTYTNYKLVINLMPVANGNDMRVRLMKGSALESDSEYRYVLRQWNRSSSSTSEAYTSGWGTDHFRLNGSGVSSSTEFGLSAVLHIMNPLTQTSTNTPNDCMIMADTVYYADNSNIVRAVVGVDYQTSEDFDGINFVFSSNNIARYNYSLFGISGS